MINGKKSKFLWFGNSISRTNYILLEDRETIQTGNLKIEGILAPGHTSGMMAYLVNDKYLLGIYGRLHNSNTKNGLTRMPERAKHLAYCLDTKE